MIEGLQARNKAQATMIVTLNQQVSALQTELNILKNNKNSNNSHTPPCKDENRVKKNQSLPKPTGLKIGGQPGHEGNTLECRPVVPHILKCKPVITKYVRHTY